nr:RHS repeat-associated core domain-containing protein [Chryseobacterium sp. R2A-55]
MNGGGQLQFTLPIALPPGVKSVAPQINLVYTSGSGNGIAGYGWNISGITAISRVGRNIDKDGEARGVQLDYSDYYSFNGQRLILKSGEYGKDGAEYVTEKFSNVKIRSMGAITGQQWKGPEYWEVTFEDGSQAWYGATPEGGYISARTPVEYNIVKWRDAQGNYINYSYTQANNVAVISSIQWGGNETLGKVHFNEIVFSYYGGGLKETSYLRGAYFEQNNVLNYIMVKANGSTFKRYQITYTNANINGDTSNTIAYRFPSKITEYNSEGNAANAIDFASKSLTTKTEEKPFFNFEDVIMSGDYNGDGLIDFMVSQPAQNGRPEGYYIYFDAVNNSAPSFVYLGPTSSYFPSSLIYTFNIKPADNIIKPRQGILVAKHLTGYVPPETGDIELHYYSIKSDSSILNTFNNPLVLEYSKIIPAANYEYSPSTYPPLPDPTYNYIGEASRSALQGTKEIDIDSDGLSETVLAIQDSKCFNQVIVEDPLKTRWDCRTLGYRYLVIDSGDLVTGGVHTISPPLQMNILSKTTVMDFDNDGNQDIMYIKETGTNVNVSFYTRPSEYGQIESTLPPIIRSHSTPLNNIYQYEIKKVGDQYTITYKNLHQVKGLTERIMFGDLNGDGNIEILAPINYRDPSSGDYYNDGWSFYLNKGNSLTEDIQGFTWNYKNGPDFWGYTFHYPVMLDLDNDGKSEFVSMLNYYGPANENSNTYINLIKEFKYDPTNSQIKWSYNHKQIYNEERQKYILYPIYGDFRINTSNSKILIICKPVDQNSSDRRIISFTNYNLGFDKNITSITQGGVTTQIDYRELDPSVSPGVYAPVKSELFPYMELDKIPQSYAVSQLSQVIPVNSVNKIRKQDFRYRGLITHLQGRGMVGFRQTARSSWYSDGFENTKIWSGAEIDPLNDGVPIKEWSIKTNTESQIFPADISESNTQLLSFKSTAYRFDKLLNGSTVDINTVSAADKPKMVSATVPTLSVSKDFLKDVRTESSIIYDVDVSGGTKYYLPVQTASNINNGFAVSTTELSYIHNPSGTGKDYYIGRPAFKTETMNVYGDSKGAREEYEYEGNLLKYKMSMNRDNSGWFLETYDHDGFGNITEKTVTTSIDLNYSKTDKAQYDPKGRFVIKKTDNLGLETQITYNDWGQLLTQTDPLGNTLTNEYDGWGKLLKAKTNLGGTITYQYRKESNGDAIITEYAPDGGIKISYTNKVGQNYRTTVKKFGQGEYSSVATVYDELGRKTKESEPYSNYATRWNTIEYDDYSRPVKATSFTGKEVVTTYNGRTVTTTETNANNRFRKQTADPLGNIISSEDLGGIINFKFNAAGENTEANYEGNIVKTDYDVWGNKVRFEDPSNGVYEYQYSGFMGALSKVKSPKGEKTYEYNSKGQLITQKEKTTTGNVTDKTIHFEYNDKGAVTKKYGTSLGKPYSSGITYDGFGRVLSSYEDSNGKYFMKKGITYDEMMRVTSYEKSLYSSGVLTKVSIENIYDDAWSGELYQVKEKGTGKILWQLNEVNDKGQVTNAMLGNVNILNTYAASGFLSNTNHAANGTGNTVLQIGYSFNAIKNELNSRTTGGDFNIIEQFQYDDNNRLYNWTDPVTGIFTQNQKRNLYDNKGRITENDEVGTIKFDNAAKKYRPSGMVLNTVGTTNYDGDLLQKISYNENNDPVFIDGLKGDVAFEYGLTSMRQRVTYGGNFIEGSEGKFTKYYSEDGSFEIIKDNISGQEKHLIYIGGTPYESNIVYLKNYTESSGSFKFLHKDYLGSILAITDEAGTKLEQRHFDAWGNVTHLKIGSNAIVTDKEQIRNYLSNGNLIVDRGYTSHEHFAEVGLIHMNGRLYDPLLRRFLNADENIQDPHNTQNYNKYGYVLNNPLMYNDPSGEFLQFLALAIFWKAVGIGIAVGLASAVITAGLTGQQIGIGGILKSAFIGGISAAVTFGIGSVFSVAGEAGKLTQFASGLKESIGGVGLEFVRAGMHAVSQGVMSLVQGNGFLSGATGGFFGSLGAAGFGAVAGDWAGKAGGQIFFGALSGGIGAELTGGNFWQGAVIGGIVAGLNHTMHEMDSSFDDGGDDPKPKKNDDKQKAKSNPQIEKLKVKLRSLFDTSEEVGGWMEITGILFAPVTEGGSFVLTDVGARFSAAGTLGNMVLDGIDGNWRMVVYRGTKYVVFVGMGKAIDRIPGGQYVTDKVVLKIHSFLYDKIVAPKIEQRIIIPNNKK